MTQIKINSYYTIGIILIFGYILIFISVIRSQHSSDEFQRLQQELQYTKDEMLSKSRELKSIKEIKDTQQSLLLSKPINIITNNNNNNNNDININNKIE